MENDTLWIEDKAYASAFYVSFADFYKEAPAVTHLVKVKLSLCLTRYQAMEM
jgi:hypothetical protein